MIENYTLLKITKVKMDECRIKTSREIYLFHSILNQEATSVWSICNLYIPSQILAEVFALRK